MPRVVFPGEGYRPRVLFVRAFGVWGTDLQILRRGGFLEAPLTQFREVAFLSKHPSRSLWFHFAIPLRSERDFSVQKSGVLFGPSLTLRPFAPEAPRDCEFTVVRKGRLSEGFRDPRSLCGGLRRRPLETVNLRWFVRVASGRASATRAHSAAVFAGGL